MNVQDTLTDSIRRYPAAYKSGGDVLTTCSVLLGTVTNGMKVNWFTLIREENLHLIRTQVSLTCLGSLKCLKRFLSLRI